MKKTRLLLFFILFILLTSCQSKEVNNDKIFVGRIDIIDHIDEGPGNLSLRFFSYKPYNDIKLIIDQEDIRYDYDVLLKNHQVKLNLDSKEEAGYMHLLTISFFDENFIDLSEVIMQFDNIYRLFDIGRYKRVDIETLTGVNIKKDNYVIDFVLPIEITKSSFIPNLNIDLYVSNKNEYTVLSKNIYDINQNPNYHLLIFDNKHTTPIISPNTSKVTKNIYLTTKQKDYVHIKTYFLYELAYEVFFTEPIPNMSNSIIVNDLQIICLEIGLITGVYALNDSVIYCDDFGVGVVINYIDDNINI